MGQKKPQGVNRREFLKTATAATAAAATVGVVRPGYVAEGGPLKVGLIGCGGRGNGALSNVISAAEHLGVDLQIVALADVFPEKAESTRKRLMGGRGAARKRSNIAPDMCFSGLDAYKKLLATDVNYVILATPPGWRPMQFEAAVEAKKHIFAEKPVATDPVGCRRFMAAAKRSEELGLHMVAGTQRRHEQKRIETIKKIHDGAIGDILAARAYWCSRGAVFKARKREPTWSDLEWQLRAWYSYCWIGGDNIVEQHIHNLDMINWALDAHPVAAVASGGRAWKGGEPYHGNIFDHFTVDYEYPNGVHVLSMSRHWFNSWRKVGEYVVGTKGGSNTNDLGTAGGQKGQVQEHIDLIRSILGKGPHCNEAMRVAESTMTAILGRESAYSGRRLTWDDIMKSQLDLMPKNISLDPAVKNPPRPVPTPGKPGYKRAV